MIIKASFTLVKRCCVILLLVLIGAAFTLEAGTAPANPPATSTNAKKAMPDIKPAAKSTFSTAAKATSGAKINLNTADKASLEKLADIGPVKAQAIIDGRPYKAIHDVMRVKGIKGKIFEKIKDHITVQ